jgi:hypothetical protein
MPNTKSDLSAIDNTLMNATLLASHSMLNSPSSDAAHQAILSEIKQELRALQGALTGYDDADAKSLQKWSGDKHTEARLTHITTTLDTLQQISTDRLTAAPSETKWQQHQLNVILQHQMSHLRIGTKYNKDFVQFLGLESFIKQQRETAERIKKLETAKEVIASAADLGGKIKTVVSTSKNVAMAAEHAGVAATGAAHGTAAVAQAAPLLSQFLSAVPIVGAAITAGAAVMGFGKSFLKNKGVSDKVANGVMVGVSAAALALTIVFPVAAAAIGAGMVAAGAVMNYVKPYFEMRKQIKECGKELEALTTRVKELDKPGIALNQAEKKMMAQKIQQFYIANPSASLEDLKSAKQAINTGNYEKIQAEPLVKAAFKLDDKHQLNNDLKQYVLTTQDNLKKDITGFEKKRDGMMAQAVNSIFTVAGAVMLAIPFPPVQIAGAALLVASSIAGVIIKYQDQIKQGLKSIVDGFKKLFSSDKSADLNNEKTLKNTNNLKPAAPTRVVTNEKTASDIQTKQVAPVVEQPKEPATPEISNSHSRRP